VFRTNVVFRANCNPTVPQSEVTGNLQQEMHARQNHLHRERLRKLVMVILGISAPLLSEEKSGGSVFQHILEALTPKETDHDNERFEGHPMAGIADIQFDTIWQWKQYATSIPGGVPDPCLSEIAQ
jgi:hypothetical protein